MYYFVCGITKDYQDKILLDKDNKILFFTEQKLIFEYLKENNPYWDKNEFKLWIDEASSFLLNQDKNMLLSNVYASIDINRIRLLFVDIDNIEALSYDSVSIRECLLFLNFLFEYGTQVNDKELTEYRNSDDIDILYEFFYDFKFWEAPEVDKRELIERIERQWNELEFKETLSFLIETFFTKIRIY